jgi:hypothetical protein
MHMTQYNPALSTMMELMKDKHFVKDDEWQWLHSPLEQARDFGKTYDSDRLKTAVIHGVPCYKPAAYVPACGRAYDTCGRCPRRLC